MARTKKALCIRRESKFPHHRIENIPCPASRPDESPHLLLWIRWYWEHEVNGVGCPNTSEAKTYDLEKLIIYFHHHHPEGLIRQWKKAVTQGFVDQLRKEYSTSTVNRVMATVGSFAKYLVHARVFEYLDSPARGITLPKSAPPAPRPVVAMGDDDVVEEGRSVCLLLYEAAKEISQRKNRKQVVPYRDIALFSILYHTGLRVSEVCGLDIAQIRRDKKTGGVVFTKVLCKGSKERDVFLNKKGTEDLNIYLRKERGKQPGPLFCTYKELTKQATQSCDKDASLSEGKRERITRFTVWRITKRLAKLAKVKVTGVDDIEVSPHRLRHERAYNLLNDGFSESEVADELGHSDGSRYVGLYIRRTDRKRYDRLNSVA